MRALLQWADRQYRHSAQGLLRSLSPVHLVKHRPGFGQSIRAAPGAIIASPVLAAYDPDPDYFFHWFRDSAVVIEALRLLYEDGSIDQRALTHFADFVQFSLNLLQLNGADLVSAGAWRQRVQPDFERFLRSEAELAAVTGPAVSGETRVNPDGSLDISKWGRPQHDGPALRALSVLRWLRNTALSPAVRASAAALLRADLEYTVRHWRDPCFDIWEEESGLHYFTLCVSMRALAAGARWFDDSGEPAAAQTLRAMLPAMRARLDQFWSPELGYYRSRTLADGQRSSKELDIAVILAAIHAPSEEPTHSVHDARMHATLHALERLFTAEYPINRALPSTRAAAMGRYQGDVYYSGGAYYFSTLGAAEFCFRAAAGPRHGSSAHRAGVDASMFTPEAWIAHGDAFLATVRTYTPANGELSEQFDRQTGAQTSAKQLAWSYAAFISCLHARRAAEGLAWAVG